MTRNCTLHSRSKLPCLPSNLQACLVALHAWFAQTGLAHNHDKTEVIQMSTTRRAKELSSVARVNIAGASVKY